MASIIASKVVLPAKELTFQRRARLADSVFASMAAGPRARRERPSDSKLNEETPNTLASTVNMRQSV